MSEKSTLRVHAQIIPPIGSPSEHMPDKRRLFRRRSATDKKPFIEPAPKIKRRSRKKRSRSLPPGDRLLRNSAIACAALLGVLSLGNIDRPWAQKASESIEKALTMHIDLDDTIGDLTFVRDIMPESALVFLNISGKADLARPVSGNIAHPWNELQPWIMFTCAEGDPVQAVREGTVTAVSPLSNGSTGILIDHGGGIESVYAYLGGADVVPGDSVEKGQRIGSCSKDLYFEWRSGGQSIDPSAEMGL